MNQITAPGGESNHSFLDKDTRGLVKKRKTRSNDPATSASRFGWRSARIRRGLRLLRLPLLFALLGFVSLAAARAQESELEVHVATTVIDADGNAVAEVSEKIGDLTVVVTATTNGNGPPDDAVSFWVNAQDGTAVGTEDFGHLSEFPVFSPKEWRRLDADGRHGAQRKYALSIVDDPGAETARETVHVVTTVTTDTPGYVTLPGSVGLVILDDDVVPGRATSLQATAAGPTAIDLSWTAPRTPGTSRVRGYWIEWSADGATAWTALVSDTNSAATTYTDTGLAAETTRSYRVSALSAAGVGQASKPAGATTTTTVVVVEDKDELEVHVATTVIDADGNAVAEVSEKIGDLTVVVTATTNGNGPPDDAVSFWVNAQDGTAVGTEDFGHLSEFPVFSPKEWRRLDADGRHGAQRKYALSIVDDPGAETARETVHVVTTVTTDTPGYVTLPGSVGLVILDDDVVPGRATSLQATAAGPTAIDLSWTAPRTPGTSRVRGYRIEWSADGATAWTALVSDTNSAATTYTDTGLAAVTTRSYRVSALSAAGVGQASKPAGATTTTTVVVVQDDDVVPGRATSLQATAAGPTAIDLSWTAPSNPGTSPLRGYWIEWSADGATPWKTLVLDTNSSATTYTDSGLTAETTRYYRVSALSAAGVGAASAPAGATTDRPLPDVTIASQMSPVNEGADATFVLTRTGETGKALTVAVEVTETGSMINGTAPLSAVFEPEQATAALAVPTVDDSQGEADSSVVATVTASQGAAYAVGSDSSATVVVHDNDDLKVRLTMEVLDSQGAVVTEVAEGAGVATVRITAATAGKQAPTQDLAVAVLTEAVTAAAPEDYGDLLEQIGFGVTDWSFVDADQNYTAVETVSLTIVDDSLDEPDRETLRLITTFTADTPSFVTYPPALELAIIDNDTVPGETPEPELPEVDFSGWTQEVIEGETATLTLVRSGPVTDPLTVSVEVSETGSTISGEAPTSVVFPAGADFKTLSIRTVDDEVNEPDSVITATLTAGQDAGYVVGSRSSATVTVSDDNEPSAVTVPGPPKDLEARADGEDGIVLAWTAPVETGGVAIAGYRIEWSADGESGWSVLVDDLGSTATTFSDRGLAAGTTRYYRVCALNSAGIGPPSNVTGARTNLAPVEVTIQAKENRVVEGAEVAFTLRRTGVTAEPLSVSLGVTATAPMLGSEPPTSALFPAGADETTLTVRTIDDRVEEPDGEIVVTLLSGNGYTLGGAVSATVRVRDNDGAPVLSIIGAAAPESRGNLMFVVTLQGRTSMPVEAVWSTSPGTATADQDYVTVSGVLTLDPGSTGGAIVIPLRDDAVFEENETFTVSLSRPKNAELGVGASSATGVIENDDEAPVIRIADASAPESAGEIGFTVSLSGESALPATVRWTTEAETAQPGTDYVEVSGELVLGRGATSVRLGVPLIEDLLHEESETFRLVLSGATNAVFDGASEVAATGTIEDDDDAAPAEEWLARFGRTAASNAVNAVEDRLTGRLGSGAQVVVAGHRVDVSGSGREHGAAGSVAAPVAGLGVVGQAAGGAVGPLGSEGGLLDAQSGRHGSGRMGVGEVLARSSFQFSSDSHGAGHGNGTTGNGAVEGGASADHRWSVWGSGAATRFNGGVDNLSLDGEVVTGTVGADIERGRVLFGVAVSHSRGDGDYRGSGVGGLRAREGDLSSVLTTGLPYLRVAVSDRLSVWGALGSGAGSMTLNEGGLGSIETDIGMSLGAFGARQELRSSAATEGFSLALRTDLLLVHTTSDEVEALPALSADVNRLRLMVEGARRWQFESGAVLTPSVELGLRYDDGDAEKGSGLEMGAGLRLENAVRGLSAELTGRSLLAHEASELSEWGVGGSLRFAPGGADRGLSIGLRSTLGAASSGIVRLWEQQTEAPAGYRATAPGSVTEAEIGYGLAVLGSRWSLTPYLGAGLSGRSGEAYKAGARLRVGEFFALDAEAARVERNDATPSVYQAAFLANLRW